MNLRNLYIITGYLSILVGIAGSLCIYRVGTVMYGVGLAIIGFILSGINIFLNTKYEFDAEKFPKGYFGMFFSSLPVIFMMLIIFKFRK